jgi:hypothetical protein
MRVERLIRYACAITRRFHLARKGHDHSSRITAGAGEPQILGLINLRQLYEYFSARKDFACACSKRLPYT